MDFVLLKEVKEFLHHWIKPAICKGFSSTIVDTYIWGMVLLRGLIFVNIFN